MARYTVKRRKHVRGYSWVLVDRLEKRVVIPTRDPVITSTPTTPHWLEHIEGKLNAWDSQRRAS
jgi:hypothetical protein